MLRSTRLRMRVLAEGYHPATAAQLPDLGSLAPNTDDDTGAQTDRALIGFRGVKGFGTGRDGRLTVDARPEAVDRIVNALAPLGWRLARRSDEGPTWSELTFERAKA